MVLGSVAIRSLDRAVRHSRCFLQPSELWVILLRSPYVHTPWAALSLLMGAEFSLFRSTSVVFESQTGRVSFVSGDSFLASNLRLYLLVSLSIACTSLGSVLVFPDVSFHVCHRTDVFLSSSGLFEETQIISLTTSAHRGLTSSGAAHFFAVISREALVL